MEELIQQFVGVSSGQVLLVWAAVIFGALMRSFTGFGFGLAAVPIFALFMSPANAVVLSACLVLAVGLINARSYWGQVDIKPMRPMIILSLMGTAVGVMLLTAMSADSFRLYIGLSVIVAFLVLTFYKPSTRGPKRTLGAVTGLMSGVLNGAFAVPGPPAVVYVMATQTEAAKSRASLLTFFTFSSMAALTSYTIAGFVSVQSLMLFVLALPAMILGERLGFVLFLRFGSLHYRRIALGVLLIIGVSITYRALVAEGII